MVLVSLVAAQQPYQPKFSGDPAHSDAEAAALGYMRTAVYAQKQYQKKHQKFAPSLAALAGSGSFTRRMINPERGDYTVVSPNDHVNMAQSTNDTFPTAMRVATLNRTRDLLLALDTLLSERRGRRKLKPVLAAAQPAAIATLLLFFLTGCAARNGAVAADRAYNAKKYDEARGIWQARVTLNWRFYFTIEGDTYTLLTIRSHPK